MTEKQKVILTALGEGVVKITLNRPEVRNAIDEDVIDQLNTILDKLETNSTVRLAIITGEGEAFCSGGDLSKFHSLKTAEDALKMLVPMSEILKRFASLPFITVAYMNGHAVGGGCEIAASCDFRVAKPYVKTGFIQGQLQITTGWGGASLLKEKIGFTNALIMLSTARTFTVEEGVSLGWIQAVVEDEDELRVWCEQWKLVSHGVLSTYKHSLRNKQVTRELFKNIDTEVKECATLWEKEEHHQAVNAFLSK
ncbi:enoyl-CoA hydratase/isomerase family protein [Alteribacter populi]|uniref:enoyl-CoA hydratase/isomerase family protein n=1 Tax=Alteribacter populi TaxID=2011011 RepID=UPI000BBADEC4|nr:enoyl-CoA hydratase/isomerase family protein [Alteribacter populi]